MNNNIFFLAVSSLSFGVFASSGIGSSNQTEQWIFKNGYNYGNPSVPNYACYRIPAIVKLDTGELLAFAEGRQFSCSDHDSNTEIVMRKRDLQGNWGPISIVADHGGRVTRNPGPVVDDQGNIHLLYNVNYDSQNPDSQAAISESKIKENNNRYRASVFYIRSSDNGNTWTDYASQPVNIDDFVHPHAANESYQTGLWSWYAITPGHALKLDDGKLFFPANHSEYRHGFSSGDISRAYSHAITLDPTTGIFALSATVGPDTNENMAEQLDNGWVYMNMRNNHRSIGAYRAVSYSKDGGENWMGTEYGHIPQVGSTNYWRDIGYDSTLITPRVQASVIRYTSDKDETGVSRLLFSNPADRSKRKNGTIRVSYDEGKTWTHAYRYNSSTSKYSDLIVNDDKMVGILYEEGGSSGDGIYYIETNLEKITGEKDAYIAAVLTQFDANGIDPSTDISAPHQPELDPQTGDLTVTVTFALSAAGNTQATQFLARKGNALSTEEGWGLLIENGMLKFRANDAETAYGVQAALPANLGTDKHTITAKFDRSPDNSNEMMSLYLDGSKLPSSPLYNPLQSTSDIATTKSLSVAGSDNYYPLKGLVFGYQVYDYGLDSVTIENYAKSHLKDYNFSSFFNNPENNNFEDFFTN